MQKCAIFLAYLVHNSRLVDNSNIVLTINRIDYHSDLSGLMFRRQQVWLGAGSSYSIISKQRSVALFLAWKERSGGSIL